LFVTRAPFRICFRKEAWLFKGFTAETETVKPVYLPSEASNMTKTAVEASRSFYGMTKRQAMLSVQLPQHVFFEKNSIFLTAEYRRFYTFAASKYSVLSN
jgi:hypothetical protein